MLKNILVSIVSKLSSNILLMVDDSKDNKSATVVPNSNQLEPIVQLDSQPTFLYSKETLQSLQKIFPKIEWSKKTDIEDLAFNAGQQSVISFIERRLGKEVHKVIS